MARRSLRVERLERRDQPAVSDLDIGFNGTGQTTYSLNPNTEFWDEATAVATQADGRILVAGYSQTNADNNYDFVVVRYNANGTLDGSFGTGGRTVIAFDMPDGQKQDFAEAIAIQADGRIVVAGRAQSSTSLQYDFAVARLSSDGFLDNSFGTGGKATFQINSTKADNSARAIGFQSDGKILLGGYAEMTEPGDYDFAVIRLNTNGTQDLTFGTGGKALVAFNVGGALSDEIESLAVQADNAIVVVGTAEATESFDDRMAIARLTANGLIDNSFGTAGKLSFAFTGANDAGATDVAIQPDGKIVVVGYTEINDIGNYDFAAARLTTSGKFDSTFDGDGKFVYAFNLGGANFDRANAVAVQPDGKIVIVGQSTVNNFGGSDVSVLRLTTAGKADTTFNTTGGRAYSAGNIEWANDVAVSATGQIVTVGATQITDLNYNMGVSVLQGDSAEFSPGVRVITSPDRKVSSVTAADGVTTTYAVDAVGNLFRYNANGTSVFLAGGVNSVSAGADTAGRRQVYVLFNGGNLWKQSEFGGWTSLSSNVAAVDAESGDTAYILFNGGFLYRQSTARGWVSLGGGVQSFQAGQDAFGRQQVYVQYAGGFVWQNNAVTGWRSIAGGVASFSAGTQSDLWVLFNGGNLWRYDGVTWSSVAGGVSSVSGGLDAQGRPQANVLFTGGFLWRYNPFTGWASITSGVTSTAATATNDTVVVFTGGFLWRMTSSANWQALGSGF